MKRITYWAMSTLTALVLLLGYHTSTSSSPATAEYSAASGTASATGSTGSTSSGSTSSGSTSSGSTSSGSTSTGSASTGSASNSSTTTAPTTSSSPTSTSTSTSATSATSTTVTGEATQTRYGPVQVRLTVTAGKVTAVDVLQQPDGNGMDEQINAQALPILVSETLKAQSADIDMVSGATYTSDGYTTSLQSALDQAGL